MGAVEALSASTRRHARALFCNAGGLRLLAARNRALEAGTLVMFYVAVALAVFAKGPVGLLPLLAAAVWLWTEDGPRGVRLLWTPAGVGLFALITLGRPLCLARHSQLG
jgi:hypothetical protein